MRRSLAIALVALLVAASVAILLAPAWILALALPLFLAAMRRGRIAYAAFTASTLAINALLFWWLVPAGPAALGIDAAVWTGLAAGTRLAALVGANVALLSHASPARVLDALRLPKALAARAGALALAAHDVVRDARRLRDAQRLAGRGRTLREAARLVPALVVASMRRAEVRRDALHLIGHRTGPRFVPVLAITALAIAGRLAFLALPNLALTYVIVFAGGLLFGARVGILSGLAAMAATDLLLTGLLPSAFANAFAMALVGAVGGLLHGLDFAGATKADRAAGRMLAAAIGVAATLAFSVASDALTWTIVAEFRSDIRLLWGRIGLGLAFNVVPAIANGILFAAAVGPLQSAVRAWQGTPVK